MRDPNGYVDTSGMVVLRRLYKPLPSTHFLHHPAANKLVIDGDLIPFSIRSDRLIESRKVPFVSYPYEWTHSQLLQAASCTLNVAEVALEGRFEIKDATAFNVIFRGARAEFCDHLSFEPITSRYWWAYGQFLRHFLIPLAASKLTGVAASSAFKTALDGITLEQGKALLGAHRWRHRIALAFLQGSGQVIRLTKTEVSSTFTGGSTHLGLIRFLRWQLDGLAKPIGGRSQWGDYEHTRTHYTEQGLSDKRSLVGRWMSNIKPQTVLDLGCNQGEFSLLASDHAGAVIALDADEASLEKLRQRLSISGAPIQTVLVSLDDPSPARGWAGSEFASLIDRLEGRADMVLALALLHHLVLGCGISIENVTTLLARLTRQYLVVELIPPVDEKARQVSESHNRQDSVEIYSLEHQCAALAAHFSIIEEQPIEGSSRVLALMQKKNTHA